MSDIRHRIAQLSTAKRELLLERLRAATGASPPAADRLVAYVRTLDGVETGAPELRAFLRETLPEYMVPSAFVFVPRIPLTASGKLDVAALPDPDEAEQEPDATDAPRTPAEELMVGIWREVLGGRAVGTRENFFDLGGHSLLAVQIVARARNVFRTEVPLRWLFESPTVEELAARVTRRDGARTEILPITPTPRDLVLRLSYEQEALWMTEQVAGSGAAYSMPAAIRMKGALDAAALERAVREIVQRHEVLRTTFAVRDGEACQVIAPSAATSLPMISLHDRSPEERERAVHELTVEDALAPFDLAIGPLFRATLVRLTESDHVLLTSMHHIVSDGWSLHTFIGELRALYAAFVAGRPSPLAPLPIQYADYAVWQRARLRTAAMQQLVESALARLAGAPEAIDLPTDRARPLAQTFAGASHAFAIPDAMTAGLIELSRAHGATLFMTCAAAFQALLYRYTHDREIVLGTPSGGRMRAETEGLIGYFVNTLVLRTRVGDDPMFTELVERTKQATLDAYAHQEVPFTLLVERLKSARDPSRSPVFQVMCELQNFPESDLGLDGLELSSMETETETAKFDLILILRQTGASLAATFEYSTDLFDATTIERLASHLHNVLAACLASPHQRLSEIAVLDADEVERLVHGWNRTDVAWDRGATFRDELERRVDASPDAIAVVDGERTLTYAELNARANRLARALRVAAKGEEPVVAALMDRGIELLVTLLAALKSGSAYLPLDPSLPRARLEAMLAAASCAAIVRTSRYASVAVDLAAGARVIVDVEAAIDPDVDPANPGYPVHPRGLAYVLFTSGSTGAPKGAMIEQRGMLNHLRAKVADLGFTADDRLAQTATQSFDVSIWQLLTSLLAGGRVVVFRDESAWDPAPLLRQIEHDRVTVFETVPTHMTLILDELESGRARYDLSTLRWFIVNGEPLLPELCARWLRLYPRIPLINAYGPTECSDDVTHYKIHEAPRGPWRYVPISGTLPNLQIYVLDARLAPVPLGVAGELYVGGVGVGRGYIADPAKTATSFIPDPFSPEPGARLYRTGDVVRYRVDGVIEFIGRRDDQVKIRGFRIEIGEIEATLSSHESVRECVVVVRHDMGPEAALVAYVAERAPGAAVGRELAEYACARLPPYMVPSAFVALVALPLLPNGKVDRSRLPSPQSTDLVKSEGYIAPRTPTEIVVARIWEELLGVPRVGATDGFFQLGGHSLIAIRTIARVRNALGVDLSVRVLFERLTVAGLAAAIDERRVKPSEGSERSAAAVKAPIDFREILEQAVAGRGDGTEERGLAPHQLPEWYMRELEPTSAFYNVAINDIVLVGDLDLGALTRAFQGLVARHDIFRFRFAREGGKPTQRADPTITLDPASLLIDLRHLPVDEARRASDARATELGAAPFDFERGPIFRFRVVALPDERFRLLFAVHHIVWDETSTMNFARELAEAYRAHRHGQEPVLPPLALGFLDYAYAVKRAVEAGHFDRQRRYWLSKLSPPPPALDLPTDFPRPALQTFAGSTVSRWLPAPLIRRVTELVRRDELTLNIFFLAVLNGLLYRLTGQRDFVVGTPIANRDDQLIEPLIGLFATAVPMRARIAKSETFRDLLRATRETAIDGYDNHHYPSVLAIQEVNPELDLSRNRLFSVMFGVQNNKTRLMNELHFDGLELELLRDVTVAEFETSKFDLTVVVDQLGDDVVVHFNYNTNLFKQASAARMLNQLIALADQASADLDRPLDDYALASADEIDAFRRIDDTSAPFDRSATIHGVFAAQAARSPDAAAVVDERGVTTYGELERASNRLARHLVDAGVQVEDRVAVLLEPSVDLVVALLAVMKAGAAYVPIVATEPGERRARILERSGARVLVSTQALGSGARTERVIRVDADAEAIAGAAGDPVPPRATSNHLAYVIFTSGTTGEPKGIEIEHRGVINLLTSTDRDYRLTPEDRVLLLTPIHFDASVLDVFWTLSTGAAVVVPPSDAPRIPAKIAEAVRAHGVTVFQCVPLLLQSLVESAGRGEFASTPTLRLVICGGALLTRALRDRFAAAFDARLANHYGPTEVTVDATRFDARGPVDGNVVPIGAPLANTRVYVLDASGRRAPFGVVGEIHVASVGLARGYTGEPERTAEAFIPDPFSTEPGARMYRTGDLGRCRDDGHVEFVGRVDKQVKVRGNRVELEEIEVHLASHPAVGRCVVRTVGRGPQADALVAYVELDGAAIAFTAGDGSRVRAHTLAQRPELAAVADAINEGAWPPFLLGDCTLRSYWSRLGAEFPAVQIVLTDEADEVVGVGNATPIRWSGAVDTLFSGFDVGLESAFMDAECGVIADTLLILTSVAAPRAEKRGSEAALLRAHCALARALGYARVLAAVRPTGAMPEEAEDFARWSLRRDEEGRLEDARLRTHEELGGRILRVDLQSHHVRGTIPTWEAWTGRTFPASGAYRLPNTFGPVRIDLADGHGEYDDPCVWIEHPIGTVDGAAFEHVDALALREFMKQCVPEYMVPEHFRFVGAMPVTSSGKVDERALATEPRAAARHVARRPQGKVQKRIAEIWALVLQVPSVGVNEDFFELGGHSIRAIEMLAKVNKEFDVELRLRDLFAARTILEVEKRVLTLSKPAPATPITAPPRTAPDPVGQEAVGVASGHHGEVLQGVCETDGRLHRVLVTLPCALMTSEATFFPDRSGRVVVLPSWKVKAARAVELALAWVKRPNWGGVLEIRSKIPVGWGLGSSTTDVLAAIRAVAAATQHPINADAAALLAVQAESASDSIMYADRAVLFAHREGRVIEDLGGLLPPLTVLGFNTDPHGVGIDTLAMSHPRYSSSEIEGFRVALGLLRRAVRDGDPTLLGRVATASSRVSQRYLPKLHFEAIESIASDSEAVGVQAAHSGTVAGLLFDAQRGGVADRIERARRALGRIGIGSTWPFGTRDGQGGEP